MTSTTVAPAPHHELRPEVSDRTYIRRRSLVDDPLSYIAIGVVLATALQVRGPVVAAAFAVVLVALPGSMVVRAIRPRPGAETVLVVVSVSLVFWMLVAHTLLTLEFWHPEAAIAATTTALVVLRRRTASCAPHCTDVARSARGWIRALGRSGFLWSAAALTLWAMSLGGLELDDISQWGLVTELPVVWFLGFGMAVAFAARSAMVNAVDPRRIVIANGIVLLFLYGTLAVVSHTLRYPWSYKHVGVVRLLDETGRLHPNVDIYNNFSGFFGLGALVRGGTGVDPLSYGAWAQLITESAVLIAVWTIVRRAVNRGPAVAHLAVLLYAITNWVGQNYFAPQALGTFFSLTVLALVCAWFVTGETRRLPLIGTRHALLAPVRRSLQPWSATMTRRLVVCAALIGVLMTHPLTPISTLLPIMGAIVVGWLRDRALILMLVAATVLWTLRLHSFVRRQGTALGFGGSVADNAGGNVDATQVPDVSALVGTVTKLFSVGIWALAIVALAVAARRGARPGMLSLIALGPVVLPFIQAYGGEAIYRTYLYTLPGMVGLIAILLVGGCGRSRRERLFSAEAAPIAVCLAIAAGFVVVHYARERVNQVEASEVAISEILHTLPDQTYIAAQFAGGFPAEIDATYPQAQVNDTYTPTVAGMLDPSLPLEPQIGPIADDIVALTAGNAYLTVTPGMIDEIAMTTTLQINSVDDALDLLAPSERFVVVHQIGDSWLLQVLR